MKAEPASHKTLIDEKSESMAYVLFLQSVPWAGIKWLETTVTISLIVLSIVIAGIITGRYLRFSRSKKIGETYVPEFVSAIKELKWEEALALSEKHARKSHLAGVLVYALYEGGIPNGGLPEVLVVKHMSLAMERAIAVIDHDNRAGLGILDAIGATSPFIGALGGSALTFAFGIMLAIPTIWFATYLRNKTLVLQTDMKNAASEFISGIEDQISSETSQALYTRNDA